MSFLKRLFVTGVLCAAWAMPTTNLYAARLFNWAMPTPILYPVSLLNGDPYWTWTGFYAGVNLGIIRCYDKLKLTPKGLWGAEPAFIRDFVSVNGTTRLSNWNFIGGGQIGYNYQRGCYLYGLEIDGNYLNLRDHRRTPTLVIPSTLIDFSFREHIKHRWLVTLRPRVGIVFKTRFMTYLTGGYAVGDVKVSSRIISQILGYQSFASSSKVLHGWTLGAGLEYALRPRFIVRGEYLHVHLGHFKTTSRPIPTFAGRFEVREYSIHEDAIRFGLNYRI